MASIQEKDSVLAKDWNNIIRDNPQLLDSTNTESICFVEDLLKNNHSYFQLDHKAFNFDFSADFISSDLDSDSKKLMRENFTSAFSNHPIGVLIEDDLVGTRYCSNKQFSSVHSEGL